MSLKINWDKFERYAIYTSITCFIIYQSIRSVNPEIEEKLPDNAPLIFISTVTLIAIHYLIKIVEAKKESDGFVKQTSFGSAFQQLLGYDDNIPELCIVAYTSATWREYIRNCGIKFKKVRILLFYDDEYFSSMAGDDISSKNYTLEPVIASWKLLVDEKQISALEIYKIKMIAPIYFGIIGQERGMFGYLWPRYGMSGLEPRKATNIYSKNEYSSAMIQNSKKWFESMLENAERIY